MWLISGIEKFFEKVNRKPKVKRKISYRKYKILKKSKQKRR